MTRLDAGLDEAWFAATLDSGRATAAGLEGSSTGAAGPDGSKPTVPAPAIADDRQLPSDRSLRWAETVAKVGLGQGQALLAAGRPLANAAAAPTAGGLVATASATTELVMAPRGKAPLVARERRDGDATPSTSPGRGAAVPQRASTLPARTGAAAATATPRAMPDGAVPAALPLSTWRLRHDRTDGTAAPDPADRRKAPLADRAEGAEAAAGALAAGIGGRARSAGIAASSDTDTEPAAAGPALRDRLQALVASCCERLWVAEPGASAGGVLLDLGRWMPGCTIEVAKAEGRMQLRLRGVDDDRRVVLQQGLADLGEALAERLGCPVVTAVEGRHA